MATATKTSAPSSVERLRIHAEKAAARAADAKQRVKALRAQLKGARKESKAAKRVAKLAKRRAKAALRADRQAPAPAQRMRGGSNARKTSAVSAKAAKRVTAKPATDVSPLRSAAEVAQSVIERLQAAAPPGARADTDAGTPETPTVSPNAGDR